MFKVNSFLFFLVLPFFLFGCPKKYPYIYPNKPNLKGVQRAYDRFTPKSDSYLVISDAIRINDPKVIEWVGEKLVVDPNLCLLPNCHDYINQIFSRSKKNINVYLYHIIAIGMLEDKGKYFLPSMKILLREGEMSESTKKILETVIFKLEENINNLEK